MTLRLTELCPGQFPSVVQPEHLVPDKLPLVLVHRQHVKQQRARREASLGTLRVSWAESVCVSFCPPALGGTAAATPVKRGSPRGGGGERLHGLCRDFTTGASCGRHTTLKSLDTAKVSRGPGALCIISSWILGFLLLLGLM